MADACCSPTSGAPAKTIGKVLVRLSRGSKNWIVNLHRRHSQVRQDEIKSADLLRDLVDRAEILQPEKYQDTVQHVIRKGNTPAGMHISIMVKEILDFLQIQPGETGFDATLGYGGHTKAMLECLHGSGHMYATDVDPEESAKTKKRLEELGLSLIHI